NVQASDFPAGWTSTPASATTAQEKADEATRNACLGLPAPDQVHSADADSDDFANSGAQVSSSVTMAKTTDDAKKDLTALKSSKAEDCLKEELNAAMARDAQ